MEKKTEFKQFANNSSGFYQLEALLESNNPQNILKRMHNSLIELQKISKTSSNTTIKSSARKAALAYETFANLFKELNKIKNNLIRSAEKDGKSQTNNTIK